jgi:hypothetical protein
MLGVYSGYASFGATVPLIDERKNIVIRNSKYSMSDGSCECGGMIYNGKPKMVDVRCKKGERKCDLFPNGCEVLTEDFEERLRENYEIVTAKILEEKKNSILLI